MIIDEKQLEDVARAIYEANPYSTPPIDLRDPPTGKTIPWGSVDSYKKSVCICQAKAAIEAAFKPRPIEEAPYDTPVLMVIEDGNVFQDFIYDQTTDEYLKYYENSTGIRIAGWLPLPIPQEDK